jgi:hypothetical protein
MGRSSSQGFNATRTDLVLSEENSPYCNEIHADNYDPLMPVIVREAIQRRNTRIGQQAGGASST